jgi:GTP:adenosylcobinamide-phosphate guanylyltransferase/thiamine kinase-like enzyme
MRSLHVIVQAGGRGSRLRHHTWNKPKCLVSVKGKPLLYHLFDRFPDAHFHIIGDYAYDQLEKYLEVNTPNVSFDLIRTDEKGTCSGISTALNSVPIDSELIITWSDLIINNFPTITSSTVPVVITTHAFTCRWTINDNNTMIEQPGPRGIPGIFYASRAQYFPVPPHSGEFVKWFSKNVKEFETVDCEELEELGDFSTIETQNDRLGFSRFFNEVVIEKEIVKKTAIDPNYSHLIEKEQSWYKSVKDLGFRRIPQIISINPYVMQRIQGHHAYQMNDLTDREKRSVLADYLDSLINLHDLGTQPSIDSDVKETYIKKTIDRVYSVSKIIPNFEQKALTINGLKCKNIFNDLNIFDQLFDELNPKFFTPIHGDPTFSNTLIDKNLKVWYIDPRGYFSRPGIWGDPMYDFAKVYYSAVGNYDLFNRKKFKLHVDNETAEVLMEESSFLSVGKEIFFDYFNKDIAKIEILHGLIWLALSGYAKDDIDSVIGSFYLGLYYLEQGIKKL